jgi:FkbM family methyltransferase
MSLTKLFGSHYIDLEKMPKDAVIVDGGACIGNFINDIQEHIENPLIFAIEPNKQNIKVLKKKDYEQTLIIEAALVGSKFSSKGLLPFNEFAGLPEWGNVNGLYKERKISATYEVETIDIKELMGLLPTDTIDYLKMDIEGSEGDIIDDLTLEMAKKIKQMSMELHDISHVRVAEKLEGLGYEPKWMNGEMYAARKEL